MTAQTWLRLIAWLVLAGIAAVTLAPIDLRPDSGAPASLERFAAFALVGLLFSTAYPRRRLLVAVLAIGAAGCLEALQLLHPERHAGLQDLAMKGAGALTGSLSGAVVARVSTRLRAR